MADIKSEEILTCLLLIVVCYTIAKMFSKSCNGFSVGGQNIDGQNIDEVKIRYDVFEPDSNNYPNSGLICGFKYDNYGVFEPDSFLDECIRGESCVCLDENKNIKKSTKEDPSICRAAFGGPRISRCMSNEKLKKLKYPKYTE